MEFDDLLGIGATVGGLGLIGGSLYAQHKAGERLKQSFNEAVKHTKRAEMAARSLNKLRGISGNDVNIGRMNQPIQDAGMRDNAFYIDDDNYTAYAAKLMTKKMKGAGGTIAIGDEARALPVVAHELGHAENNRTGRGKWRIIGGLTGAGIGLASVIARALWAQQYKAYNLKQLLRDTALATALTGVGSAVGDFVSNQSVYSEEQDATDNAMRYLERMGRSKKQLERDRATLDTALDTYKTARDWGVAKTLGAAALMGGAFHLWNKHSGSSTKFI